MFSPSRTEAREFFFATWQKYRAGQPLEGLESTALEVILLHPEYHGLLEARESNIERDFAPESGQLNPFLHMSLHLAVAEQLAIGQPRGITGLFAALADRLGDRHAALHAMLECLGEIVWQANRSGAPPDEQAYLACLRERLERAR